MQLMIVSVKNLTCFLYKRGVSIGLPLNKHNMTGSNTMVRSESGHEVVANIRTWQWGCTV